jgi:hypothetical protein
MEEELVKIRLLERYKKGLLTYLTRYLNQYTGISYKDTSKILRKCFGRWYFEGIRNGKIVDFMPKEDIVIEEDIQYIFKKSETPYVPYKPFNFNFKLSPNRYKQRFSAYSVKEEEFITYKYENYHYKISTIQYGRLRDLYEGPPGYLDEHITILLIKYGYIGSKNNHLSVPPALIDSDTIELFGSPLNTCSHRYCSALESDKIFRSLGSFFDFEFVPGKYFANPPFVYGIMEKMVEKILSALDSIQGITIYIVIPVWDSEIYFARDKIKASKYLLDDRTLEQFDFPFYDYFQNSYIPVTDTYLSVLSNETNCKLNLNPKVEEWRKCCSKL